MTQTRTKRSGRKERHALRAQKPAINPCPPGQIGGTYKPLTVFELESIYQTALDLLERLGMGEVPVRLRDDLLAVGAIDDGAGRILFPPALVEDAIDHAARTFVLHGRDEARSIEIGGNRVYFGTGGAAVQTLDLATGRYRPSTLRDLHDFTRLQDTLANVSWYTRCCVATDVPDNFDLDVNTVFALLKNTTKPVATSFTLASHVAPIVEMLDIAAGGEG
ncbi:MAG: trimethylamine methyltransferase family protein, partial [Pseudomonadota bacterium]